MIHYAILSCNLVWLLVKCLDFTKILMYITCRLQCLNPLDVLENFVNITVRVMYNTILTVMIL